MSNPKIVYTPAGGTEQTLNFVFPPVRQPVLWKDAIRHDNIATAGVRESVLERVDKFLEINMDWITSGADLANWQAFLAYALTGGIFSYYADAAIASFINCFLEDTQTRIEFKSVGLYSLTLKMRQAVV